MAGGEGAAAAARPPERKAAQWATAHSGRRGRESADSSRNARP